MPDEFDGYHALAADDRRRLDEALPSFSPEPVDQFARARPEANGCGAAP